MKQNPEEMATRRTREAVSADVNLTSRFLARRDLLELSGSNPFDLIVLTGSSVIEATNCAAAALHDGIAPRILVTGGLGHSTLHLWNGCGRVWICQESLSKGGRKLRSSGTS